MDLIIPNRLHHTDTVHRNLTADPFNGVVTCGFLYKEPDYIRMFKENDINFKLDYYGGVLILEGSATHIDNEGHSWVVKPGSYIQRFPGKVHSTVISENQNWLEFYICIGKELFESLVKLGMLDVRHEVLNPGITMALLTKLELFLQSCKQAEETDLPFLVVEAQHILVTINQMCHKSGDETTNDMIDNACRLIGNLAGSGQGHILVEDIAKELGVGVELFRKKFKTKVGISPGEYLCRRRMNLAQSMLVNRHRSVKEVAIELGFPDGFTFSKQFKKLVGVSPSQFRKIY